MRHDTETADHLGGTQGTPKGKDQQRGSMALALISPVDGQLTQERDRYGVRLIPLQSFRQEGAFNLRRTQRYIANDLSGCRIFEDADPGYTTNVVVIRMAPEPAIEGFVSAVKVLAIISLG